MRIAFLADIHANLQALEAVLADARAQEVNHVICLGDIVGYGPQPAETLTRVREVASSVIMGNHDAAAAGDFDVRRFNAFAKETAERAKLALSDEDKAYLRDLPHILELKNIACTHGSFVCPEMFPYLRTAQEAQECLEAMPKATLLLVGHTHLRRLFVLEKRAKSVTELPPKDMTLTSGARYVINPGSVGFPRSNTFNAEYLIYDEATKRLMFRSVPYDLAPYRRAVMQNGYNQFHYWFLSPDAKRQMERYVEGMDHEVPKDPQWMTETHGFLRRKPRLFTTHLTPWHLFIGLLIALIFMAACILYNQLTFTPTPTPITTFYPDERNLLPPLGDWVLPKDCLYEMIEEGGALQFVKSLDAKTVKQTLHSPPITLPKGARKLRFSFHIASSNLSEFSVNMEFIDQKGERREGAVHSYKTDGYKAYTVKLRKDVVACRVCFSFNVASPLLLRNPTLSLTAD